MALPPILVRLKHEVMCLRQELDDIKGRLSVVEEHTCENHNRIKDLEEWQEQTDERLDKELWR